MYEEYNHKDIQDHDLTDRFDTTYSQHNTTNTASNSFKQHSKIQCRQVYRTEKDKNAKGLEITVRVFGITKDRVIATAVAAEKEMSNPKQKILPISFPPIKQRLHQSGKSGKEQENGSEIFDTIKHE